MTTVRSRDGTTIAYHEQGEGPALILVDGALITSSSGSKKDLADLLGGHFRVYMYDRRGRGDSGDTLPYKVQREIEDLDTLIDHAGGEAFVYGHSSGACLALEAAMVLGDKVARLALYEAPYNDDPAVQKAWGDYIGQLTRALAENRRGDAVALFLSYVGTPAEQVAGMRQAPFWANLEAIAPTLAYDHAEIVGPTGAVPTARLASVLVPTLVMCGTSSYPFMAVTARTITDALPRAEFLALEGQTHEVHPEALAPALIEYLRA